MRQDTREFSTDGEPNGDQKVEFFRWHLVSWVVKEALWYNLLLVNQVVAWKWDNMLSCL